MSTIPPRILENLGKALEGSGFVKFLNFLGSHATPQMIQVLEFSLGKDVSSFVSVVKLMAEDAEKAMCDDTHKQVIQNIYSNYLKALGDQITPEQLKLVITNNQMPVLEYNFLRALSTLPPNVLKTTLLEVEKVAVSLNLPVLGVVANKASQATSLLKASSLKVAGYTLLAVHLAWEAYQAILKWWKGEISGKRCAKTIVDSLASAAGGVAGGIAGAAVGAVFGPVGLVLGAVGGGLLGGSVAESLSNWLTLKLFDLPKSQALEGAFNFMKLKHTASPDEINSKFRQLCLQYHPDKGGKAEDFHKLQTAMALIKVSRGETH